ncbi:aldo/keto reductase [Aquihabitans sp. G128]|uniref:aldo/keto reductase n=1 Tax=Aquihabitans sp. G128 TaxID=2849779 RepID=UPI001C22F7D7|nr:aldo/keto reductase [Aquihabitans sp. G128]QXC61219.1 aldo/keto reductase [Aquihabitans sp. G128]
MTDADLHHETPEPDEELDDDGEVEGPVSLVDIGTRWIGPDQPVGPLGFGCWRFVGSDVGHARELIGVALDEGMDLIDTADIYGNGFGGPGVGAAEELLGKVLAESPDLRDRMVLATKGGIVPGVPYDSSVEHLVTACEDSLRRLGVDVIDLYQVHRPDLLTHPSEVATALDALVDAGKIRSVGVSNHTPAQTEALDAHLTATIDATQPELSALHLDPLLDGTGDLAMRVDRAVLAWSPLGRGALATGEGVAPELLAVIDELAAREEVDRSALALAFVLALPFRPVAILGTQDPARLRAASAALDVFLDRTDVYRILGAAGVPLP